MSAETTAGDQTEVVRWYTRARKFPKLIGRTHTGGKIWGGPYTITQFIAGGVVLFIGANTMGLWGGSGLFMDGAILLGITWGVVAGVGKIPVGSRNPFTVATGAARACVSPKHGRLEGRPLQLPRPRYVQHAIAVPTPVPATVAVDEGAPADSGVAASATGRVEPEAMTTPRPAPTPPPASPSGSGSAGDSAAASSVAPLTGVQALLASTPAAPSAAPSDVRADLAAFRSEDDR